jgi:flagellar protein FliS
MFASTYSHSRPSPGSMSGLYRQVGISTLVDNASSHRLVAMLFDGLLESLAEARGAIHKKDVEAKCAALSRASRIVDEGLKGGLNLAAGGAIGQDLHALYTYIYKRILHANLRSDADAVEECSKLIEPVREAWMQIGAQIASNAQAARVKL